MHEPVMLKEVIKFLDLKQTGLYLDFTYGIGGHSKEIKKYLNKNGNLISLDKDILSCILGKKKNLKIFKMPFNEFKKKSSFFSNADGIIIDLGVSLKQIKDKKIGLSFDKNSYLDMRINSEQKLRASDWINFVKKNELKEFLNFFLEKNTSNIITKNIITFRKKNYIKTTNELCDIIKKSINIKNINKIFMIIKILINNDLFILNILFKNIEKILKYNGICLIISFNSIEDKIIKNYFLKNNTNLSVKHISNRPNIKELNENYKARSAIMHIIKRKK